MRKISSISLLAMLSLLAALILVACGDPTATTAPAATTAAATTAAATTAAATTAAPAATTAAATTAAATTAAVAATTAVATTAAPAATTAAPAATTAVATTAAVAAGGKKLKVGLVTDTGRVDDKSFNQSAWEAVQKAGKELGFETKYVETKDGKDYAKNIKQFVDDKYDVIVTVGFLMADATVDAAKANPTTLFIAVDQFQGADLKNLAGLIFEEDKSGFLAGALAAGMSQKGKIAAVLGTKSVPPVARFGEGYKAGAAYLDANFKTLVKTGKTDVSLTYHADENAFNDPAWGTQQSQSLIQTGNDVIFGAGGGTGNGAIEAAAGQGVWVIGVDTDQYLTLPRAAPKMLSSATKLITDGVFNLLKDAQAGKLKGGNNVGGSGLAPFHDSESAIPAELKDALKKIDAGLKDGSIKTGVKIG